MEEEVEEADIMSLKMNNLQIEKRDNRNSEIEEEVEEKVEEEVIEEEVKEEELITTMATETTVIQEMNEVKELEEVVVVDNPKIIMKIYGDKMNEKKNSLSILISQTLLREIAHLNKKMKTTIESQAKEKEVEAALEIMVEKEISEEVEETDKLMGYLIS